MRLCNSFGYTIVHWRAGWSRRRVCRWLSRRRATYLHVVGRFHWYVFEYRPYKGWWCSLVGLKGHPVSEPIRVMPRPKECDMKRRAVSSGGQAAATALPMASTVLAKFPGIREFLTATAYEDGTARTPGYLTLRNRGHSFEVTLYDFDSGHRLPVRAASFDEVLAATEKLVGVEDAPWEIDSYLTEQLIRRTKKRRKAT